MKMGREFIDLFDEWSSSYDETVEGKDKEYQAVFDGYESILERVAGRAYGHVLEFGTGTGNLTAKMLSSGLQVYGIEQSYSMRRIARKKLEGMGAFDIKDGDFIDFPAPIHVDSIVSTYAFHHLTDEEKEKAIEIYGKLLNRDGRIVFADTMYLSKKDHEKAIQDAEAAGFHHLAHDLQTEYYTTIPFLKGILESRRFQVAFERCNDFVWILEAEKL